MDRLSKYFKPEEVAALKEKGPDFLEKFENQQKGQLYKEANFLYNRTQLKQMEKAAEKYENVLGEKNEDGEEVWSAEELVDHAFQELVDQSHYLTGLSIEIKKLREEIKDLKSMADYWRNKYREMKFVYEANVDPEKIVKIKKP